MIIKVTTSNRDAVLRDSFVRLDKEAITNRVSFLNHLEVELGQMINIGVTSSLLRATALKNAKAIAKANPYDLHNNMLVAEILSSAGYDEEEGEDTLWHEWNEVRYTDITRNAVLRLCLEAGIIELSEDEYDPTSR